MGSVYISPYASPEVRASVMKHMETEHKRRVHADMATRPALVDTAPPCTGCKHYMKPPTFIEGLGVCNAVTYKHRANHPMPRQ